MNATDFPIPGTPEWGLMNRRRGELIRKYLLGTLTDEEKVEYEYLQTNSLKVIEDTFPFLQ